MRLERETGPAACHVAQFQGYHSYCILLYEHLSLGHVNWTPRLSTVSLVVGGLAV